MGTQTEAKALEQLTEAEKLLAGLPGTETWTKQLDELHQRVQRKEKLVAVFGAFSAGKSSLLNALLDDNVLVVSPNPTTASVTHVHAQTPLLDDAVVTAKTEAQLWEDVQLALGRIHKSARNLDEAVVLSKSLDMTEFALNTRKYVSFLKAVADGYAQMAGQLGSQWSISRDELRRFTAEERFACFIHRVELAHPAPVLADGMVLVDTPGVDSIHRRHTDVAFHYMRSADAIVFVLYYTHAFSRADKEFLAQLADVQDVLSTNKLFVVINAIDLATNEEERFAVRNRVEKELKQLGIREPRLYEVSSQLSFAASQLERDYADTRFEAFLRQRLQLQGHDALPPMDTVQDASGVPRFRNDLRAFVEAQADQLAESAVQRRLETVASEVVTTHARKLEQSQADASLREQWQRDRNLLATQLREQNGAVVDAVAQQERLLETEWDELVYHIRERIRLKYATLFREAFHPGRFRGGQERLQLQEAAQELSDLLARQIDAECRTFALRAHQQTVAALQRWLTFLRQQLHTVHADDIVLSEAAIEDLVASSLPRHAELTSGLFRPFFRHFSSPRQFYEGGGQQEMLNASETVVLSEVRALVEEISSQIRKTTLQAIREKVSSTSESVRTQLVTETENHEQDNRDSLAAWGTAAQWFERWLTPSTQSEPVI